MIPTRLVLNRSATLGWIGLGQMGTCLVVPGEVVGSGGIEIASGV